MRIETTNKHENVSSEVENRPADPAHVTPMPELELSYFGHDLRNHMTSFELCARDLRQSTASTAEMESVLLNTLDESIDGFSRCLDQHSRQSELMTMIVHDLKKPLTVIKPYASALLSENHALSNEQRRQYLDVIVSKCDELSVQIEDLLDIDPKRSLDLRLSDVDLLSLIEETVRPKQFEADLRGKDGATHCTFVVECPADLGRIRADNAKLKRVLFNLIDNAVKYSLNSGEVRITVCDFSDSVQVTISDQGIGMTLQQQQELFAPFVRLADKGLNIPGTGVGLFSAKRLIEAHGGQISVASEHGKGTTFDLHIPKAKDETT